MSWRSPDSHNKRIREEQGRDGTPGGKRRAMSEAARFYVLWPERFVGHLIGKAGSTIAALRRETHATILVEDAPTDCEEQVVTVSSPADRSPSAFMAVAYKLSEIITEHQDLVLRLLLTSPGQTGAIIGRRGETIEGLRRDFRGTDITLRRLRKSISPQKTSVLSDPSLSLEVLEISGRHHDEVLRAARPIAELLASAVSGPSREQRPVTDPRDFSEENEKECPPASFAVMVPKSQVGQLIGRGGRVISTIRQDTRTELRIEDHTAPGAEFRTLRISSAGAGPSAARNALMRCVRCLTDDPDAPLTPNGAASCWLVVPTEAVGAIIGHHGDRIRTIREHTGASITVVNAKTVDEHLREALKMVNEAVSRLVLVEGDPAQIEDAMWQISEALLANNSESTEPAMHGASPCRQHAFRNYKGDVQQEMRRADLPEDMSYRDRQQDLPGRRGGDVETYDGNYSHDHSSQNLVRHVWKIREDDLHKKHQVARRGSASRSAFDASEDTAMENGTLESQESLSISISNEQAGCIIGKGGANIAIIRQISKASVAIRETAPGQRTVVLEGTYHQIQAGKSMVQAFLAKDGLSLAESDCKSQRHGHNT